MNLEDFKTANPSSLKIIEEKLKSVVNHLNHIIDGAIDSDLNVIDFPWEQHCSNVPGSFSDTGESYRKKKDDNREHLENLLNNICTKNNSPIINQEKFDDRRVVLVPFGLGIIGPVMVSGDTFSSLIAIGYYGNDVVFVPIQFL